MSYHPLSRLLENPPHLKCDIELATKYGNGVTATGRLERRIVWNLLHFLAFHGFTPRLVDNGDEYVDVHCDPVEAMEKLFEVEDAQIMFAKSDDEHWVKLVNGNGVDIISDWTFTEGDTDGFNSVMQRFNAEDYA